MQQRRLLDLRSRTEHWKYYPPFLAIRGRAVERDVFGEK